MKNKQVAELLHDIADMLEMQGIAFKPQAYRKAARVIETLTEDIVSFHDKQQLTEISGVGEGIAKKIAEFLETGKSASYEKLKKKLPSHLTDLMDIPSLGPKKIKTLHEKLGIASLPQLEAAIKEHKIQKLEGFGQKSEEEMAKGLELLKSGIKRRLLAQVLPVAVEIEEQLRKHKAVEKASIAGSVRRRKDTIGDVDILVTSRKPAVVMNYFTNLPIIKRVLVMGSTKASALTKDNLQVDVRVVDKNSYGAALVYFTGSKEHNVAIRARAVKKGLKINEYGVFKRKTNKVVAGKTEQDVYKAINLPWIAPEIRENSGELAQQPQLITEKDIKGDFHLHTAYTDGANTIKEMIEAAKQYGYEYVAITDHSPSTRIANGNTPEEMLAEIKEIKKISAKIPGITVFAGSEVDILPNGDLDFPEKVLKKLDIVVASVHSRFKSTEQEMTQRICTALENEHLTILGHPTGRRISRREPYAADMQKIFKTAVENNVVLEINGQPERMDLKDAHVREAKEMGARFAINTDSHNKESLHFMEFGVSIARRGWLEKKDVINTYSLKQLKKMFKR